MGSIMSRGRSQTPPQPTNKGTRCIVPFVQKSREHNLMRSESRSVGGDTGREGRESRARGRARGRSEGQSKGPVYCPDRDDSGEDG